jgi:hypothetical protein
MKISVVVAFNHKSPTMSAIYGSDAREEAGILGGYGACGNAASRPELTFRDINPQAKTRSDQRSTQ